MTLEIHKRQLSARFSAARESYHQASSIQQNVADATLALVPERFIPGRILDAGCGTGTAMRLARSRWPGASITGIDIASGMISQARLFTADDPGMTLQCADMVHYQAGEAFDLILSTSALHWARPIRLGLENLIRQLKPGGFLAAGIMLDGTLAELREARSAAAPGKTLPAALPMLGEITGVLQQIAGIKIHHLSQSTLSLTEANGNGVLQSLHQMGVTGGDFARAGAALNRSELRAVAEWYDQHYRTGEGVRVTFVAGYLLVEATG